MKALDVAKYVVTKCKINNTPISNLQLQKILYYVQYSVLTKKDKSLIDEEFEAWKFGPVIPIVYYEYSYLGAFKIHKIYEDFEKIKEQLKEYLIIIDPIIEDKIKVDPWQLVEEAHLKGKAWYNVFNEGLGFREIIPKNKIKDNAF